MESFISVVFPRSYGLSDEMDSYSRNTQTRDAMSANRLRNSKQSDLQNMYRNLLRPVAIQGPLRMENSNVSKSRDACKPSDISCIRSKSIDSANAPVIVISYDNGMVKFCLLNCSDEVNIELCCHILFCFDYSCYVTGTVQFCESFME